jgi:SRSO17 transposase
VQPPYCGNLGKQDNGSVTVYLGYAVDDFPCLLPRRVVLAEELVARAGAV